MAARTTDEGTDTRTFLCEGWMFCSTGPEECATPDELQSRERTWHAAKVPCTVASSLRSAGLWTLDSPLRRFDADDWWFRLDFDLPDLKAGTALGFDGLATLCEVWLNGERQLSTSNMFVEHCISSDALVAGRNVLYLVFRSLDASLSRRRTRPRWRVSMIENQQLRWFRTTLLGRTPGWSLPAAPVGPWRPVWLGTPQDDLSGVRLHAEVENDVGILHFSAHVPPSQSISGAVLELRLDGKTVSSREVTCSTTRVECTVRVPDVALWWPHTHGTPSLYNVVLVTKPGPDKARETFLGAVGFRTISRLRTGAGLALAINGTRVFCRGACWTPLDAVSLGRDSKALRHALEQVVAAGFNMLRISGTCAYEDDEFFILCDELGIMIWQEFMFASMDYPADDPDFQDSVRVEAKQQLGKWSSHPCVAVVCGNSEVSQQAAMWGRPGDEWYPPLFDEVLRRLTAEYCPNAFYWPSSASEGDFPHQPGAGSCSYYGVGAYQRGLDDARRSEVAFATECLAFANVPDDQVLSLLEGGSSVRAHSAAWKRRSPRDLGAGWDFDDVRDHYLRLLFAVDPTELRYSDHPRYLVLSRQAIAEAVTAAFTEWRRPQSHCNGALVWFLRDMWPGAGWGIIDSLGNGKSPYFALRRALQPRWIGMTDEGLNGVALHVVNERQEPLRGRIELVSYRSGQHVIERGTQTIELPPRSARTFNAATLLGGFRDLSHSYRFAPLACDVAVATLICADAGPIGTAYFLPRTDLHVQARPDCVLSATAESIPDSRDLLLKISSNCFARGVYIDCPGHSASDQFFNIAPGGTIELVLRPLGPTSGAPRGFVSAINAAAPAFIQMTS
jgi:beta-mannosidase